MPTAEVEVMREIRDAINNLSEEIQSLRSALDKVIEPANKLSQMDAYVRVAKTAGF